MNDAIKYEFIADQGRTLPVIDVSKANDARRSLALSATIETFALLQMLQREQERGDDMFASLFRGTMVRLEMLNYAMCDALAGVQPEAPAVIATRVYGEYGWRDSRDPSNFAPAEIVDAPATETSDLPLLAQRERAEIVENLGFELLDQIMTMDAQISRAGATGAEIHSVWIANIKDLLERANLLYATANDDAYRPGELQTRFDALPDVENFDQWLERQPDQPLAPALALVPVEPTVGLLRPFYNCKPNDLMQAWAAMLAVANNQFGRGAERVKAKRRAETPSEMTS